MSIILSGHQPTYLPSLGLFAKMKDSDIFMHCGHLQYEDGSWQDRNRIQGVNGEFVSLRVPTKHTLGDSIRNVYLAPEWHRFPGGKTTKGVRDQHLKSMSHRYAKEPYFANYYPGIAKILGSDFALLDTLCRSLTDQIAEWLGIKTRIIDSANWHLGGDAISKIIQMCQAVGADTYLSNSGAADYIGQVEEERFREAGIKHAWINYADPDDVPLSVVHHLFMRGPDVLG